MSRNMRKLCLKIPFFQINLSSKILADLDLELQLFYVMEFCGNIDDTIIFGLRATWGAGAYV